MRKVEYFCLSIIIFSSIITRLYRIDNPVADWHSWRQADTAAVTRNFVKEGINLLRPRYDDLSNIASGRDNPQGWRFVEFPLYNGITVLFYNLFPDFSVEKWGRLVSIGFAVFSLIFLYILVRKYLGAITALFCAGTFALLPYNIFYGRAILPEPALVFFSTGMLYFFSVWITERKKWGMLFLLFGAGAMLIKPITVFLFLPMGYLAVREIGGIEGVGGIGGKMRRILIAGGCFLVLFLPFFLWRFWMRQFPEGIPAADWLLNGDGIRFKGAFFYWLIGERLGKLILTAPGMALFLLGIVRKPEKKEGWFFHFWLIGIFAYFVVVATGNIRHDYYQVFAVPVLVIFMAKGAKFLFNAGGGFHKWAGRIVLAGCLLLTASLGWYEARGFFNINHPEIVLAGKAVDKLTPKDAKVIAPYNGDTAFLYQTNRRGWPIGYDVEEKIKKGASYYVSVNFDDEAKNLKRRFTVIEETKNYVLLKLEESK